MTPEQIAGMLRDVALVERYLRDVGGSPLPVADLCCHVKALADTVERQRETLLRIAARDYSKPDILAHVADCLGITVKELEALP